MNLQRVLNQVPGVNRRFIYYLESQGYIRPERLQKTRIARRDYSQDDVRVIGATWRYYSQGFSLQSAYNLAVKKDPVITYVAFHVGFGFREKAMERLLQTPEAVEAARVYSGAIDMIVKLATPREADLYGALIPLFAEAGIDGVPIVWRTISHFENSNLKPIRKGKRGMMAYVLIKTPGKFAEVLKSLTQLEGIAEASALYGESDVLARVVVPDQDALDSLVMDKIHKIPFVESTRTYLVVGGTHWVRKQSTD